MHNPSVEPPKRNPVRTVLTFLLKLAVTGGLIYYLLHGKDPAQFKSLLGLPLWTLLAVGGWQLFQHCVSSTRWLYLLRLQGIGISFWESFMLTWQSFFYSLVMPGGTLGGDLVKVTLLCTRVPKGKRLEPASTIFIDRVIGMLGLFGLILLLMPLALSYWDALSPFSRMVTVVLIPLCTAGIMTGIGMFFHREIERLPLIGGLIAWVDRRSKGKLERLLGAFDIYRTSLGKLLLWALASLFLIHIPSIMIVWTIARGLGLNPALMETLFAGGAGNAAGMLPTMGGFGTRETTTEKLLHDLTGIPLDQALVPVMGYAAMFLIFCLLGGIFALLPKWTSVTVIEDESDPKA